MRRSQIFGNPSQVRLSRRRREAGFSLVELLVTMVIMAQVLLGLLMLFDSSNKMARSQTQLAGLQQSLRVAQSEIVRYVRMAGLGGLPLVRLNFTAAEIAADDYTQIGAFPNRGYALSLFNNVKEATIVQVVDPMATGADAGTDMVVPGTDVLLMRGVFTTPMYYFDPPLDISTWVSDLDNDGDNDLFAGTVILPERPRISAQDYWDYPQDISLLAERLEEARSETNNDRKPVALMLRDTLNPNAYVVAAFDSNTTTAANLVPQPCPNLLLPTPPPDYIPQCISFNIILQPTTPPGQGYGELSTGTILEPSGGPMTLLVDDSVVPPLTIELPTSIGSIGLLEEMRLFVRAEWEIPGDIDTRLAPILSRAFFLPTTNIQLDRVDLADNVLDLQIAIGADSSTPGQAGYGVIADASSDADEILFNAPGDTTNATTPKYKAPPRTAAQIAAGDGALTWYDPALEFHFLRINTLAQARFPDPDHRAPQLMAIEDHNRGAVFQVSGKEQRHGVESNYRRRWMRTIVEMRNLQ